MESRVAGGAMQVTVIDPITGREASVMGPARPGAERALIALAAKKLRRVAT